DAVARSLRAILDEELGHRQEVHELGVPEPFGFLHHLANGVPHAKQGRGFLLVGKPHVGVDDDIDHGQALPLLRRMLQCGRREVLCQFDAVPSGRPEASSWASWRSTTPCSLSSSGSGLCGSTARTTATTCLGPELASTPAKRCQPCFSQYFRSTGRTWV